MRIVEVTAKPITLPMTQPFKIALGTSYEYEGVIVRIDTNVGITGYGEASPSARITGETIDTVMDVIENKLKPVLLGKDPLQISELISEIHSIILFNSSAKCAIDIALHDIWGKYEHKPLKKLLGKDKDSIATSITIGLKSIKETIEEAKKLIKDKIKVIKIKLGENPQEDVTKIKTFRGELGYDVRLRVDANQGYSVEDAITVFTKLEPYEIEFVEQPVPYWDIQGLKTVKDNVGIPVMADESLHTSHDAINLIRAQACQMFNIKLMKSGGINEGQKIARLAEEAGISCMIGCMTETRIAVAAATHLALATPNIKYADLDGHLMLKEDVAQGGVITEDGENSVTDKEGLGIQIISL